MFSMKDNKILSMYMFCNFYDDSNNFPFNNIHHWKERKILHHIQSKKFFWEFFGRIFEIDHLVTLKIVEIYDYLLIFNFYHFYKIPTFVMDKMLESLANKKTKMPFSGAWGNSRAPLKGLF